LNSAIANATNNHQMIGEKLYVFAVTANQGATIKRSLPRAKGSANMIRKRHSHIEIVLSDDPQQKMKDKLQPNHNIKKKAKVDPKIISNKKTELKQISQPKQTVNLNTNDTQNEKEKK
jgi:hypothetical protein